jgi:hypothetical protein
MLIDGFAGSTKPGGLNTDYRESCYLGLRIAQKAISPLLSADSSCKQLSRRHVVLSRSAAPGDMLKGNSLLTEAEESKELPSAHKELKGLLKEGFVWPSKPKERCRCSPPELLSRRTNLAAVDEMFI